MIARIGGWGFMAGLVFALACLAEPGPGSQPTASAAGASTSKPHSDEVVDSVVFDNVPLPDAIRALAQQAQVNIQFDPKLLDVVPPRTVNMRWHQVTAKQALTALLDNENLKLVMDPGTKIGRITGKDAKAPERLIFATVGLKHFNTLTNIVDELQPILPAGSAIVPDKLARKLVIRTTEKEMPAVKALITKLDIILDAPKAAAP